MGSAKIIPMNLYDGMTKQNTGLVVIDPINSCAAEQCEYPDRNIRFSKIRTMLPKLNVFAKRYRKEIGGLVIVVKTTPWTKNFLPLNIQELYTDPGSTYYSSDTTGFAEWFYAVETAKTDVVIEKNSYDAFTNDVFAKTLKERGIRYIIMTGIFTDGCVLATIVNGFSRGYNFVILKDLIETTDVLVRQELQKNLIEFTFPKMYGKTIESQELLASF